jgi:hypothetical protein
MGLWAAVAAFYVWDRERTRHSSRHISPFGYLPIFPSIFHILGIVSGIVSIIVQTRYVESDRNETFMRHLSDMFVTLRDLFETERDGKRWAAEEPQKKSWHN